MKPEKAITHFSAHSDAVAESGRIMQSPKPDVSIEKQFQSHSASISFSSITGDTMSPTLAIVSFIEQIQLFCPVSGDGGTISAGLPMSALKPGFMFVQPDSW